MKKNIVILGAGFGGLRAAKLLCKKLKRLSLHNHYQVILIDRYNHHTYTPLLYEVATTAKETADYLNLKSLTTYSLKDILSSLNIEIIYDEVQHLDLLEGAVHLAKSKLKFDYLIIALGSENNYFDIPGLKENSLTLKTFDQAIKIRNAILFTLDNLNGKKDNLNIIIGGGGSTGVELAGEIKMWTCQLEKDIKICRTNVKIIEAAPTVLPGFDQRVIHIVTKRLKKLGVKLMNGRIIKEVDKKKIILDNGQTVEFDILIWTGGVKAISLTKNLPLKLEKKGRIEVIGALECLPESPDLKIYGHIYAIGDNVCVYNPKTEKPIPGTARAAINQAKIVSQNIIEEIKKEKGLAKKITIRTYQHKEYPYIIPIGGKFAIAKVGPFIITGLWGWVLKGLVELNYLFSIMSFGKAIKIWLKGLKVFIQNDRLG